MDVLDTDTIARQVESGEYYKEARKWYAVKYHMPIAERCLFIVIGVLALVVAFVALGALTRLMPINPGVPFVVTSSDVDRDIPLISRLSKRGESPDAGLRRYVASQYTLYREEYDPATLERNYRAVYQQSTPEVFARYNQQVAVSNPQSPLVVYENHSKRQIEVQDVSIQGEGGIYHAKVAFSATILGDNAQSAATNWLADIAFQYSDLKVNEVTREVTPMTFKITSYDVKEKTAGDQQP